MKKFTLLFMALLTMVGNVNAKDKVTTLWEGTFSSVINVEASNLKKDGVVTVYFTSKGANLKIYYNAIVGEDWSQTALPSLSSNQWFWQNSGVESYSFTLSEADMTVLSSSANGLCFDRGDTKLSITRITLTESLTPTSTGSNLLDADWATSTDDWETKSFAAQAGAKIGDIIKINVTCSAGWAYAQINVKNTDGSSLNNTSSYGISYETETDDVFEYEITNLADLKKIQANGFKVEINKCKITSIALVTYADSYGYITFTIGDTGYATWSSDKKYDFASAGLTAYYASSVSAGTVTLTSMDITWDWQGYIIKGTEGEYDVLESLTTDGTYYPGTNYLKQNISGSTVDASTEGKYHYIFAKDKTLGVGFYKLIADHTLAANKAYLETSDDVAPAGARVALVFDEGTTAIPGVREGIGVDHDAYYTLGGQRVMQPVRGLYIKDGKKVIVK